MSEEVEWCSMLRLGEEMRELGDEEEELDEEVVEGEEGQGGEREGSTSWS